MVQGILDHRYELLEHIGGGGMADVYKAHDNVLDRLVAVKILHAQLAGDAEFIEKFHREAQGAAKLSHSNIVNIYDVGEEADKHYIVMEYVAGETLKTRIQQQGHLSVAESLRIGKEIAKALAHAHENNLVHCDIKPHNILVMADGRIKVADFGIARAVTSSTMTYNGTVVGSVHYFSPEQAKGTKITPKSDIYSLGVVLYEMLTGQLPFVGETTVSIALKHLQEEPASVRQLDATIPPIVEAIVQWAMAKEPDERPSSEELVTEISQAEDMLNPGAAISPAAVDPFATQMMPRVAEGQEYDMTAADETATGSMFKSKKFIFGLLAVLIFGFLVGAFLSYGKFWSNAEVEVPNVVGKPMALAQQVLEAKNLRVKVAETYDESVPAGQVVSQSPEAGSKVKEQRLVTIYVSKGGEDVEMPDLQGMTRSAAEERLKKMGLKVGSIYEKYSSEEDAGTVIAQTPRAGSKIMKGQSVDLTISKGTKSKKVRVPDFTGGTLDAAQSSLSSLKLRTGTVVKQASRQAEGTIVSQTPAAGSEIEEGSAVDFVVAVKSNDKPAVKPNEPEGKTPNKKK